MVTFLLSFIHPFTFWTIPPGKITWPWSIWSVNLSWWPHSEGQYHQWISSIHPSIHPTNPFLRPPVHPSTSFTSNDICNKIFYINPNSSCNKNIGVFCDVIAWWTRLINFQGSFASSKDFLCFKHWPPSQMWILYSDNNNNNNNNNNSKT